jgi:hypothetical protein
VRALSRKITKSMILLLIAVLYFSIFTSFSNVKAYSPSFSGTDFNLSVNIANNATYTTSSMTRVIEVSTKDDSITLLYANVTWYLDSKEPSTLEFFSPTSPHSFIRTFNITELSNGEHTIRIEGYAYASYGWEGTKLIKLNPTTVSFNVIYPQQPTQSTQPTDSPTVTPASKPLTLEIYLVEIFFAVLIVICILIWVIYRKLKAR